MPTVHPGIAFYSWHSLTYLLLQQSCEVLIVIIPIWEMRKNKVQRGWTDCSK